MMTPSIRYLSYVALVITMVGCGASAMAQSEPREVCDLTHTAKNLMELSGQLPQLRDLCLQGQPVVINTGELSAAEVAAVVCRFDAAVVVDKGKVACVIAPKTPGVRRLTYKP